MQVSGHTDRTVIRYLGSNLVSVINGQSDTVVVPLCDTHEVESKIESGDEDT